MSEWLQDWGSLLSSVVLLGVTGWYAYLTRNLAGSAKASAESSKEAAQASLAAVAAAVATVPVDFSINPSGAIDDGRDLFAIQVMSQGATVFVHSATLVDLGVEGEHYSRGVVWGFGDGQPIALRREGGAIPRRLHKGESIFFWLPKNYEEPMRVAGLELIVSYSLDGQGPAIDRRIYWEDEEWTLAGDGGSF